MSYCKMVSSGMRDEPCREGPKGTVLCEPCVMQEAKDVIVQLVSRVTSHASADCKGSIDACVCGLKRLYAKIDTVVDGLDGKEMRAKTVGP